MELRKDCHELPPKELFCALLPCFNFNVPVEYLSQQDFTSKGKLSFITAPSVVFENDTLFDKVHFLEALFEQAMSFESSDQQWLSN